MIDNDVDDAVGTVLDQIASVADEDGKLPDEVEISNGTVFRIKKVPVENINLINQQMPVPKPPIAMIEAKGREEENPNDPDYLQAVEDHKTRVGNITYRLFLSMGTEVVKVGPGLYTVEDEAWVDFITISGLTIDVSTPPRRYIAWLMNYLLTDTDDAGKLWIAVLAKSGIMQEGRVVKAIQAFRSGEKRGADNGSSAGATGDGNTVPTPPRRVRRGNRGKGRS